MIPLRSEVLSATAQVHITYVEAPALQLFDSSARDYAVHCYGQKQYELIH
jgi:hypothetical protein